MGAISETVTALADTIVTDSVSAVTTVFSSMWTLMSSNPVITVFIGGSLVGVGCGVFRKLRKGVGGR